MADSILEVRSLTKRFGRRLVLSDVSFSVSGAGRGLLVVGPSGCGKTTLLRCLAMLEPIDAGEIRLEGTLVSQGQRPLRPSPQLRKRVSMVFQHLYLWPHLTVLNNIALPLRVAQRQTEDHARDSAMQLMRQLGVEELASEFPSVLSGGQQQRVAIARAMAQAPPLLLLDEILSSLDSSAADAVLRAVADLMTSGTSVVIVSHNEPQVRALAEAVLRYTPSDSTWRLER